MYHTKSEAIRFVDKLIENAEYSNFGSPKATDKKHVVGYLNFKAKGLINDTKYVFRIAIQIRKDGLLYYNHEINIKKEKA